MSLFSQFMLTATTSVETSPTPQPLEEVIEPTTFQDLFSNLEGVAGKVLRGLQQFVADYWQTVVILILVYFIGRKLIKLSLRLVKKSFDRSNMEEGTAGFLLTLIKVALNAILIIILAGMIGIESNSFVAILGSIGLALGLALQGSLANLAGGVLILVTKPFKVGDYIVAETNEGTVTKIDMFYTHIVTADNQLIVMPNGSLSNMDLKNVTNEVVRRLDLVIPVSYSSDIRKVKAILADVCRANDKVLEDRNIDVVLYEFGESAINMGVRVWVNTENYWSLKWELQESIKYALDDNKIEIPFRQLDVTLVNHRGKEIE